MRTASLFVVFALAFAVAGCSSSESRPSKPAESSTIASTRPTNGADASELRARAKKLRQDSAHDHEAAIADLETAGKAEEKSDANRVEACKDESLARREEKGGDSETTRAAILRGRSRALQNDSDLDAAHAANRLACARREEQTGKDLDEASAKLSDASRAEPDAHEKARLQSEATCTGEHAKSATTEAAASKAEGEKLDSQAKQRHDESERLASESAKLDPTGVPSFQNAHAKELHDEARRLRDESKKDHEAACGAIAAAGKAAEKADGERGEATKLEREARCLEKGGNQELTRAQVLRARAHRDDSKANMDEVVARNRLACATREDAAARDQEKSAIDLNAAATAETDGHEKTRLQGEATLIVENAHQDEETAAATKRDAEALGDMAKNLREQARRLRDEANKLDAAGA
jgi:hypothetical protein